MSGFMHGLMEEIAAAADAAPVVVPEPAAPVVAEAAPEPVAEAPVDAAAAVDSQAAATAEPVVATPEVPSTPEGRRATVVARSRFNALHRENEQNVAALAAAQAQMAALQEQLGKTMAAQNPAIAAEAAKTATSEVDWIQKMLDDGAELPEALVSNLRTLQSRADRLEQSLARHDQREAAAVAAQAERDYDAGFAKLQARCPEWNAEHLHEMLAEGVKPARIVGFYDQANLGRAAAPAAAPAAAAARPARPAPPPQLDAPATPSRAALPEVETAESYREFLRSALH